MRATQNKTLTDRQAERLQRILDAARRQLGEVGVERMTMRNLAAMSGVSAATLYNRFGTKDSLVTHAVLDHYEHAVLDEVARGGRAESPIEQIAETVSVIVKDCLRRRGFAAALMRAYFKIGNEREMPMRLYQALVQTWHPALLQMQEAGRLQEWASIPILTEELSDRMFGVVMKWSQGLIPTASFMDRALVTVLVPVAAASKGEQAVELSRLLAELSARLQKRGARAGRSGGKRAGK